MKQLIRSLHALAAEQATDRNYEIVKDAIAELERLDATLELMGHDMIELRQQVIRLTGNVE